MTSNNTTLNKLSAVIDRRRKHKRAADDAFKEARELCRTLHDQGLTLREIAEVAGVSHVAVRWWIREKDSTAA